MKYFLLVLAVFAALVAVFLLIVLVAGFTAWRSREFDREFSIILPGRGLVVSGPFALAAIFMLALFMLALTAFLLCRLI
ncbi:MAG TPA: hypothetical protein VIL74_02880 [Pyrinomonadaceae bacterium]|jgi:hypothetical protein